MYIVFGLYEYFNESYGFILFDHKSTFDDIKKTFTEAVIDFTEEHMLMLLYNNIVNYGMEKLHCFRLIKVDEINKFISIEMNS